jgi:pimeloyl-ACP methyl ester carboxylesterase
MKPFIILLCLCLISACSNRDLLVKEREYVANKIENNANIQHQQLQVGSDSLHYAAHGNPKNPAFIIIHGTPGNWKQYARYLFNKGLLEHYYMVVIDRPGWGQSLLGGDQSIASFKRQAAIIAALAKKLRQDSGKEVVIMGHSLGASLAPRVAIDFPELVDGLLLLAGTLDPALSSPRWFNYVGAAPLVKYIIGDQFHRSNKEIFALKKSINAMADHFKDIQAEIIAVQGMKDGLVYPANIDYIQTTFNPERTRVIRLKDDGHLFPMIRREEVVEWAKMLLENIRREDGVLVF